MLQLWNCFDITYLHPIHPKKVPKRCGERCGEGVERGWWWKKEERHSAEFEIKFNQSKQGHMTLTLDLVKFSAGTYKLTLLNQ